MRKKNEIRVNVRKGCKGGKKWKNIHQMVKFSSYIGFYTRVKKSVTKAAYLYVCHQSVRGGKGKNKKKNVLQTPFRVTKDTYDKRNDYCYGCMER